MWVKFLFWLTLLLWIADIAQPGYLQFYNWQSAVVSLQKVQKIGLSPQVGGVRQQALPALTKRKKTQLIKQDFDSNEAVVPPSTPTSSNFSNCRVAKNDFESVLLDSQVGCWLAVPANARNKN